MGADHFVCAFIGGGDRRIVGFDFNVKRGVVDFQDKRLGFLGGGDGGFEFFLVLHSSGSTWFS